MTFDAESYLKSGSNELRVLEYRTGPMSFGINILKVSKIVTDLTGMIRVPGSHPAVMGVFRDMNRLVPIIDLNTYLAIPESEVATDRRKVIVTEFFGLLTGFLVDRVDWIHHFIWEDVIDAEHIFAGIHNRYVIGLVKPTEDRMVQLLDYETILLDLCPHLGITMKTAYQGDADFTGKSVLIAEDSPAVRAMLVNEMSNLGFAVTATCDGIDGWEAFERGAFDLVISDVEMPRMDGLALTLRIRQSDRPATPVVVYSSIGDLGMKARARFLKADAHITKLNLDKLIEVAGRLIAGERLSMDEIEQPVQEPAAELIAVD
jgi:two-component system chemotaxis response regulator CheV